MDNNGNVVMTNEQAEFTLEQALVLLRILYDNDKNAKKLMCNSIGVSVADFDLIADGKVKVV